MLHEEFNCYHVSYAKMEPAPVKPIYNISSFLYFPLTTSVRWVCVCVVLADLLATVFFAKTKMPKDEIDPRRNYVHMCVTRRNRTEHNTTRKRSQTQCGSGYVQIQNTVVCWLRVLYTGPSWPLVGG